MDRLTPKHYNPKEVTEDQILAAAKKFACDKSLSLETDMETVLQAWAAEDRLEMAEQELDWLGQCEDAVQEVYHRKKGKQCREVC
jgi:hypothetical protein